MSDFNKLRDLFPENVYKGEGGILLNMDCLEAMKRMPDGCVDLVVTDPPYAISLKGITHERQKGKGSKRLDFFKNDDDWQAMIHNVVIPSIDLMLLKMKPTASIYIWCSHRLMGYVVERLENKHGMKTRPLIWLKKCTPPAPPYTGWSSGFELCIYGYRSGRTWNQKNSVMKNIIESDSFRHGQPNKVPHPTQKPLKILSPLIEASSNLGDIILDSFCGSGTTLVAAKQLGRKFIGVEIEPKYIEICQQRLAQEVLAL